MSYRVVDNARAETLDISSRLHGAPSFRFTKTKYHCFSKLFSTPLEGRIRENCFEKFPINCAQLLKYGVVDSHLVPLVGANFIDQEFHLKKVQIETLLKCNLTCQYCYCGANPDRKEQIPFKNMSSLIRQVSDLGALEIDFTGGEFLLRRDWKDILAVARNHGIVISLHSNASLLNERAVSFLSEVGTKRVQISADSHIESVHNSVRGSSKSYKRLVQAIERLHASGIEVIVNLMCHKLNVDHIAESYDFFSNSIGVHVIVDWIAPFGLEKESNIGLPISDFIEATQEIPGLRQPVETNTPCGNHVLQETRSYEPHCGIGHSYMFVTAQGEMSICPTMTSREDLALFGGPSIYDTSVADAWLTHDVFVRERFVNCENVSNCSAGRSCRGGCRAIAYALTKETTKPDLIQCNRRKNASGSFIDFYKRYDEGDFSVVSNSE